MVARQLRRRLCHPEQREAAARRHRWFARRALSVCAFSVVAIGAAARQAYSHPLHTTLTELTIGSDGRAQIVLRAFIDDFAAAIVDRPSAPVARTLTPPDTAAARYLEGKLVLVDAAGRQLPLAVSSVRRTNELVWVTLHAPAGRLGRGARLTNRVLFERFEDQVNIVQATVSGRRQTLLFTRRDGAAAKPLAP